MIKVRCPGQCWKKFEIDVDELPAEITCPRCGASLKLSVALLPAQPKASAAQRVSNLAAA